MTNGSSKYIMYFISAFMLAFVVRANIIMLYPFKPLEIHSFQIYDSDNVVTAGDTLYYTVHFTKHTDYNAMLYRRLVNSYVITLPEMTGTNQPGEHWLKASVQVPEFADPGTYRLHVDYVYRIGSYPTRTIIVKAISPPFWVAKRVDQRVEDINTKTEQNTKALRGIEKKVNKDDVILKRHRSRSTYDQAPE